MRSAIASSEHFRLSIDIPSLTIIDMLKLYTLLCTLLCSASLYAQYGGYNKVDTVKHHGLDNLHYKFEVQASLSQGTTPLWLNANKYGLSSLDETNGYVRAAIARPLSTDDGRKWGLGYALDVAAAANYTSTAIVQQAYVEGRWWHGTLTIGAKEYPMELKDNRLSSGSQTLGINARPVPQVRIALPEYWTLPFANGWLHLKGHIAYGMMTDDNWQHDFTQRQQKYADNVFYHSKAGYLKLGNEDVFCPWSLELGLEMATTFGGTSYINQNGTMVKIENGKGLSSFYHAFIPGGSETVEQGTVYENEEGNLLGSFLMRVNYDAETWRLSVYADKYFEDHSSMLQMDYDGYGSGDNWNNKEKRRYFLYDVKDCMLGISYRTKYDRWLNGLTLEYLYTKYQSGPVYHDHSQNLSAHICGNDDFYNHYIYTGWQHWGQAMGNPLYTSPIYNKDGKIIFHNNRFFAFHFGADGNIQSNLSYRVLATYQTAYGTYTDPYYDPKHDFSFLLETQYHFTNKTGFLHDCHLKAGYGMDFGSLLDGINYGLQLTFTKTGLLNL